MNKATFDELINGAKMLCSIVGAQPPSAQNLSSSSDESMSSVNSFNFQHGERPSSPYTSSEDSAIVHMYDCSDSKSATFSASARQSGSWKHYTKKKRSLLHSVLNNNFYKRAYQQIITIVEIFQNEFSMNDIHIYHSFDLQVSLL